YYAIMHPVKSRYQCTMSQARRVIIIIWIASFITAIPIIFAQLTPTFLDDENNALMRQVYHIRVGF
ncbi:hypothetical protein JTE90_015833, partial [Oedothorax gibbosus]